MYGLIGEKLGHSFSKTIHEHLWAQRYDMLPMDRTELDRFLRERSFDGVNVTIPYKRTVMPYCDVIDEKAQAIGCVNTLVCRDGRLMGYNTDFDGLSYCLDRAGISLERQAAADFRQWVHLPDRPGGGQGPGCGGNHRGLPGG